MGVANMYDLGSRIKTLRTQRGLTQRVLASKVNKSVSAISSYESNAQMPPLDVLESLCAVLNVSLDYLVGLEDYNLYSTKSLTEKQKELIDLLFKEFNTERKSGAELTEQQIRIIQKLIAAFSLQ